MAILYSFQIIDPTGAGSWPPSVIESGWVDRIRAFWNADGRQLPPSIMIFDTEAELNDFLNEYRITDSGLLSDIAAWKAAHNISYVTKYYEIPASTITSPGVVS